MVKSIQSRLRDITVSVLHRLAQRLDNLAADIGWRWVSEEERRELEAVSVESAMRAAKALGLSVSREALEALQTEFR